jgi:nucleotide-binding universal stress UspA family protein
MMKTIIIPTDFSPIAINATNYAIEMAVAVKASVLLFHVYQVPVAFNNNTDVPMPLIDINEMEKVQIEKMESLKQDLEHITSGEIKIDTEVRLGVLSNELEDLCNTVQPFAVIMGNKGAGLVERLLVGSSALSAIKHLRYPVLVVPSGAIFKGIKRIGFACDFKNVAYTTPVEGIKTWVKTFHAELEILNVSHSEKHNSPASDQKEILKTLLKEANPHFFFINSTDVEKGINEFAESNNVDLLIVMPRKHNLLETLFQKNHATELAFHSHIPILSIHEKE